MQDHSAILIIPANIKAQADAVGAAMGWGENSYTIPLGDGETVTHYGSRPDVSAAFITAFRAARGEQDPPAAPAPGEEPSSDHLTYTALMGLDPALRDLVLDALFADFSPDPADPEKPVLWGRDHLVAVIEAQGLVWMADPGLVVE